MLAPGNAGDLYGCGADLDARNDGSGRRPQPLGHVLQIGTAGLEIMLRVETNPASFVGHDARWWPVDDLQQEKLRLLECWKLQERPEDGLGQLTAIERHQDSRPSISWPGWWYGVRHQQHRGSRVTKQLVRDASVKPAPGPGPAVRAEHDQVRWQLLRKAKQLVAGVAGNRERLDVHPGDAKPDRHLVQVHLRLGKRSMLSHRRELSGSAVRRNDPRQNELSAGRRQPLRVRYRPFGQRRAVQGYEDHR
jgi:hypothetical protein